VQRRKSTVHLRLHLSTCFSSEVAQWVWVWGHKLFSYISLNPLKSEWCSYHIVLSTAYASYTYLLTYLRSWALLEEPLIGQPLKNFPAFYGTRRFNTVFTRVLHWSLSWAVWIQSTASYPISLRSILIFVFPVVSFLLAFLPISYMHSSSPPFVLHVCWLYVVLILLLGGSAKNSLNVISSCHFYEKCLFGGASENLYFFDIGCYGNTVKHDRIVSAWNP
jgi:hypothetical protein